MKNELHDTEWFDRYLDRSLAPEEKQWLEKRLLEEHGLNVKYQEHEQLITGIRYAHLHGKLEQLRILESTLPQIKKKKSVVLLRSYWQPLAVAATIALVITAALLIKPSASPQQLYAQRFEAYPNVFEPTLRSNTETPQSTRTLAFRAYDRGDYATAASLFSDLLKEKEEASVLLLLGNSHLALGKVDEAQNNFLTLIKNFDELDVQAKWYLALSYLKQGEGEKARLIFQELEEPEVSYSKKSRELLKELK